MALTTSKGTVRLPAYLPTSAFGPDTALDGLIRPFLSRWADMLVVNCRHASDMDPEQDLAVFIEASGVDMILSDADVIARADGLGVLRQSEDAQIIEFSPEKVLELQERCAQWGSTLGIPMPPDLTDQGERARRRQLTLANAKWAIQAKSRADFKLFGSVQGWDEGSYFGCAQELLDIGFEDLAIGGLNLRTSNHQFLSRVVTGIRSLMGAQGVLHVCGIGEPELVRMLFTQGASSVDSASFARAAACGKRWDGGWPVDSPSPLERAHFAVANLRHAVQMAHAALADGPDSIKTDTAGADY